MSGGSGAGGSASEGKTYIATALAITAVHPFTLLPVADDLLELKIQASIPPRVDLKHCVDRLLGRPAHAHTYQLQLAADKKTI